MGLTCIDTFVHTELLDTKSKHGISFYDFWFHKDFYLTRDSSTKKLIESIKKNKPYLTEIKVAKQVFNLYYGSISAFRPVNAAKIYLQFKPKCVLDFTMGWGGRLIGAAVSNITKYIGIDSNQSLKEPYREMTETLLTDSPMQIELRFQDALTVDYSTIGPYDMVFTSPPYYSKETYQDQPIVTTSKEEWNQEFYIPLFLVTWTNLQPGGHYCLNIPQDLYETVCIPLFGQALEAIELKKYSRLLPKEGVKKQTNVGHKYKEFIYIWRK
jgi:16S rRNA G966 N2-methylase RsmD